MLALGGKVRQNEFLCNLMSFFSTSVLPQPHPPEKVDSSNTPCRSAKIIKQTNKRNYRHLKIHVYLINKV